MLDLPSHLACGDCKRELDPTENKRKKTITKQRLKSTRRRCQQFWDNKWMSGNRGHVLMHERTREFLEKEFKEYVTMVENKELNINLKKTNV